MELNLNQIIRFQLTLQTMKDHFRTTIILTILFSGMAALYSGMYPAFEEVMVDFSESGALDQFAFIPGYMDMASYVGFLNIEMYQIFWVLILGIIIGFIAAASIAKEVESKTIDMLMSNPVSRTQIIIEKFIGLSPMVLVINFITMMVLMVTTIAIGEDLNFYYLFLTHLISIPYFLSIIGIGLLISTIFDEKMKASITTMALVVGMFILDSISQLTENVEFLGYFSLKNYYKPYDALKFGELDGIGNGVLVLVIIITLLASIWYFNYKDITV